MEILRAQDVEFDVIEYLKTPLSRAILESFLDILPNEPQELVRKDKRFKELGLSAADYTTKEAVINILLEHPALMERPVIVKGNKAVIGRPSDKVEELLG
ncbi:MAG TPA: arsenate reductase [Gammaproteobacteria bacterium]|nr:arsenate reductase [Gammaproteobacteria bacterium]HIL95331.1 arsenate reductase [Pseudomonadales bacterium]